MPFLTEQFNELKDKFTAMEKSFNSTKVEHDASTIKITALETQVSDLTKVKAELESKLKTLTDDPNITAKVQDLTKENTEIKSKLDTVTKEKEEISAKVINMEKEMEQKSNIKASEIISNGKLQTPLPITPDIPVTMDVTAFLEELDKKKNISAKSEFINKNKSVWKQVLVEREKVLRGQR